MSLYQIVLFVHVVGAVGLFATLALEWVTLRGLRTSTTVQEARGWLAAQAPGRWLGAGSFAAVLLGGFYLASAARVEAAWVPTALVALVVIGVLSMVVTARRMGSLGRALASEHGTVSGNLATRLHDPLLWGSLLIRTAMSLGVVWLMTVKPDLAGSLIAIGAAIVAGLAASWQAWSRANLERSVA